MHGDLAVGEERADPGVVEVLAGGAGLDGVVQLSEVDAGPVADEVEERVEEVRLRVSRFERVGRPARQAATVSAAVTAGPARGSSGSAWPAMPSA